ncbi:2-oxoacid:ferredoxin oxidoreductase subunit beta [Phaeovibrio sulfidiphilus]|uniref:2-oxoacid:ferredoxin oxidoreductase subunit beta n=1 Tax=Phaeovibrio sulfidiphilus TaxID=1220600 RepID=A0A8J6YN63_9PROT|nr:2-oxoacid:ferredoxin oxidoreductase subunit beta [Phaeovibrio sulfidiphilus]MBE1236401.1 2-oxoacid:ferredoxin oxidoreductase subunit beta [Phaeovibrio sulfidiphilus]
MNTEFDPKNYRSDLKPVWCPGCGDYSVIAAIARALANLKIRQENVAFISGIGCSSRIAAYASTYGFHGIHGRALPLASGVKVARPDLTVLAAGGDGDGFSIGGNHFLHACRRNVDMTYIVMDNSVYGMTKGQASPTSEADWCGSKLTPEGPSIPPIQPLEVALAAQASYVSRAFTGDLAELTRQIEEAISHKGFSLVHVLSPCVTYRPEQRGYKDRVHQEWTPTSNRAEAFQRLLEDDGFATGTLFVDPRPPYTPMTAAPASMAEIEADFAI